MGFRAVVGTGGGVGQHKSIAFTCAIWSLPLSSADSMTTDFIAIDLETANSLYRSICQIGLVHYRDGAPDWEWMSYINPNDHFDPANISIHGITERRVQNSPSLVEVGGRLREMMDGEIVISHTHFDRVALNSAFDGHNIPLLSCRWLDSAMIARRAWSGLRQEGGYGLANLCRILEYRYQHHDALADAKAAGTVVQAAIEHTGVGLNQWLQLVERPVKDGPQISIRARPHVAHETVVKSGTLVSRAADRNTGDRNSQRHNPVSVSPNNRRVKFWENLIKRRSHR